MIYVVLDRSNGVCILSFPGHRRDEFEEEPEVHKINSE